MAGFIIYTKSQPNQTEPKPTQIEFWFRETESQGRPASVAVSPSLGGAGLNLKPQPNALKPLGNSTSRAPELRPHAPPPLLLGMRSGDSKRQRYAPKALFMGNPTLWALEVRPSTPLSPRRPRSQLALRIWTSLARLAYWNRTGEYVSSPRPAWWRGWNRPIAGADGDDAAEADLDLAGDWAVRVTHAGLPLHRLVQDIDGVRGFHVGRGRELEPAQEGVDAQGSKHPATDDSFG